LTAATNVVGEAVRTLHRVIVESVSPEVDAGRFAIKRIVGDELRVRADIYADGHDSLGARLLWRRENERTWNEVPMRLDNNDRWEARFKLEKLGRYLYTVVGWADAFGSWSKDLKKRADAGQDIAVDVLIGAGIVREASGRARGTDAKQLVDIAAKLKDVAKKDRDTALAIAQNAELALLVNTWRDRTVDTRYRYERELAVVVDPEKARFSAWYELFPRSVTTDAKRHGTFKDVIDRLPYVAGMGFDILYMPPIHPIGR
jgi:starch synthase (maltosyl-transferring)